MKGYLILILIPFLFLYSCSDNLDSEYLRLHRLIKSQKDSDTVLHPLFKHFNELDSLSRILLANNDTIKSKAFEEFYSLIADYPTNDSLNQLLLQNLDFDLTNVSSDNLMKIVKETRNEYSKGLLDLLTTIRTDTTDKLLKYTYFTVESDKEFINLEVYVPGTKDSVRCIVNSRCQWANIPNRGLIFRTMNTDRVDTISVSLEWTNKTIKKPMKRNLVILDK